MSQNIPELPKTPEIDQSSLQKKILSLLTSVLAGVKQGSKKPPTDININKGKRYPQDYPELSGLVTGIPANPNYMIPKTHNSKPSMSLQEFRGD